MWYPIFHIHLVNKLKLRIHYKPDRNQSKLTVCTGERFGFEGAGRRAVGLAFDRPAFFKQLLHSVPEVCSVCLADDGLTTKITRPPFLTVTLFFNWQTFIKRKAIEVNRHLEKIYTISVKSSVKVGMYWYKLQTTYLYSYVTASNTSSKIWEGQ